MLIICITRGGCPCVTLWVNAFAYLIDQFFCKCLMPEWASGVNASNGTGAIESMPWRALHFVMPLQMKLYELFVARTICKADQSQSYIVALAARMLCDSKEVTFRDTMGHSHRFGCRLLHRSWTSWRSLSLAREEWRLLSKLRLIYVIDTSSCSHE